MGLQRLIEQAIQALWQIALMIVAYNADGNIHFYWMALIVNGRFMQWFVNSCQAGKFFAVHFSISVFRQLVDKDIFCGSHIIRYFTF